MATGVLSLGSQSPPWFWRFNILLRGLECEDKAAEDEDPDYHHALEQGELVLWEG